MDSAYRSPVEGFARDVSESEHLLAAVEVVGGGRRVAGSLARLHPQTGEAPLAGLGRMFHGRDVYSGQKRGDAVGKTKRGKGTKLMVLADRQGIPLGVSVHSATPAEIRLAPETLRSRVVRSLPERLIADKGYDSDPFRSWLAGRKIELIAPHRKGRVKPNTQDGRKLRRYQRRWKIERTHAWLGNYRRLLIRWERNMVMYRAFVHVACAIITCNKL